MDNLKATKIYPSNDGTIISPQSYLLAIVTHRRIDFGHIVNSIILPNSHENYIVSSNELGDATGKLNRVYNINSTNGKILIQTAETNPYKREIIYVTFVKM